MTLERFPYIKAILLTAIILLVAFPASAQFSMGGQAGIQRTGALKSNSVISPTYSIAVNLLGEYAFSDHWGVSSKLGWSDSIGTGEFSIQHIALFAGAYGRTSKGKMAVTISAGVSASGRFSFYDASLFSMISTYELGAMLEPSFRYFISDSVALNISAPFNISLFDALKQYYAQGISLPASVTSALMVGIVKTL